jgi:hypothetical protein
MSVTLAQIAAAMPEGGLFDGGWKFSPEPLRLTRAEGRFIETLGHPLARFQQACDEVYRRSASGKLPGWIPGSRRGWRPCRRKPGRAARFRG